MIQVIRQPDGKLAVYSDRVNRWLSWDQSRDEAAVFLHDCGEYLLRDAGRIADAVLAGRAADVYKERVLTFAEANAHSVNGAEVFASLGDEELRRVLDGADG